MKILVIGLDAATMDLIEPWADAGHLPTLARLMSEGTTARLLSTPNMHSASAWTSILTGLNPGRHGLFVFSDRDYATGRQVFFKGSDRTGATISSHLAQCGLTAGLLNIPMTYRAECHAGGYTISGLDAPSLNERAFCPAELRNELFSRFPDYNFAPPALGDLMSAGRIDDAIAAWMKIIETQTAAAEWLIRTMPTDFFMTVYTASDWAGHNLWKRLDNKQGGESDGSHPSSAMLTIYRALDDAVAKLLAHASGETQVYVISDHGMGPHGGASYHLADWLERAGYMARTGRKDMRASLINATRAAARDLLPRRVKERIKSGLGADRVKRLQAAEKDSFYSSIDWARTVAYSEPGRHVININLAGRNANGMVESKDYDKVCARIIKDLSNWTDGRGRQVVERVRRRDEVYRGPFVERASDLYVYWNAEADMGEPPGEVQSRGFWWSGDHRPDGILIARGQNIRRAVKLSTPSVYDLVPTIMHAAGLPVPDNLDGRVIQDMLTGNLSAQHTAQSLALSEEDGQQTSLTSDEEALIEEKLRGLGYL
jgi:predicted AlkP superfamily phosphohydrolase/phosphomutase